jgi:hypothetical protein
MSNKYINAICKCPVHGSVNREICCPATYGSTDMNKKAQSVSIGLLLGAATIVGIPLYLMASATADRQKREKMDNTSPRQRSSDIARMLSQAM